MFRVIVNDRVGHMEVCCEIMSKNWTLMKREAIYVQSLWTYEGKDKEKAPNFIDILDNMVCFGHI